MKFGVDDKLDAMGPAKSVSVEDARVEKCAGRTPNAETVAAIEEIENDRGIDRLKIYDSIEEMMEELLREDRDRDAERASMDAFLSKFPGSKFI